MSSSTRTCLCKHSLTLNFPTKTVLKDYDVYINNSICLCRLIFTIISIIHLKDIDISDWTVYISLCLYPHPIFYPRSLRSIWNECQQLSWTVLGWRESKSNQLLGLMPLHFWRILENRVTEKDERHLTFLVTNFLWKFSLTFSALKMNWRDSQFISKSK